MSDGNISRDAYRWFTTISLRWKDNDVYGHVNNVTYYSYFDSTANQYLIEVGGLDIQNSPVVGFVVASSCEYLQPIAYPGNIDVGLRVNRLGRSSVEYGLGIFRAGSDEAVAWGKFTHVFVNREKGESVAIPDPLRTALLAIEMTADKN